MSTIASGQRVQLAYVAEVTRNVTPASPTLKVLRTTTKNAALTKNILKSAEVRASRQFKDVRHGFRKVEVMPGFELSTGSMDDMIAALLGGSWVNVSANPLVGITNPSTVTRASGSFVTDGFRPGDIITTSGFTNTANNGSFTVTAVTALALTIAVPASVTLVTEAAGAGTHAAVPGHRVDIGTTLSSFTFERQFLDISQYQLFTGVVPNQMTLSIAPETITGGTLSCLGIGGGTFTGSTVGSGLTAAPTGVPYSSFEGSLYEGGTLQAIVTKCDMTINSARTTQGVVGSYYSPDIFDARCEVTGTLSMFFINATAFSKFVNETVSQLYIKINDVNGTDFMNIVCNSIKYTGGTINPPPEGPIIVELPFEALEDSNSGTAISFQRST